MTPSHAVRTLGEKGSNRGQKSLTQTPQGINNSSRKKDSMLFLLASTVLGHATINPPVSVGSYSQGNIRIGHGCNKTSTIAVTVQIPQNVTSVRPTKVFSFPQLAIKTRPLAVPIVTEGGNVTEEVDSITWSGGSLPDNEYQDFGIAFKLPPVADGTVLYFPVTQQCEQGLWNNWTQIPQGASPQRLPFPAAKLTVFANGTLAKAHDIATVLGSSSSTVGSSNQKSNALGLTVAPVLATALLFTAL